MEIRYTAEHEWVAIDGSIATVGITEHAQRVLGDLVYIQLPEPGAALAKGAVAGVVESVKAASDLYAPLTGSVLEVNAATVTNPALVNTDPLGAGWLFKMTVGDMSEWRQLLDDHRYRELTS